MEREESTLKKKKEDFKQRLAACKEDIDLKKKSLQKKKSFLTLESQKKLKVLEERENILKKAKVKLNKKKEELKEILRKKEIELEQMQQEEWDYQTDLNNLKIQLSKEMNSLKFQLEEDFNSNQMLLRREELRKFEEKEKIYLKDIEQKRYDFQTNLRNYEANQLNQLRLEMMHEIQSCPERIKTILHSRGQLEYFPMQLCYFQKI